MQQITTNGNNSIPLPGSREIASIRVAQSCGCGYPKLYVRYKGETQYVPLKISNAPSAPGLNNRYVDVFSNQAVNGVKSFGDYIKVSSSYIKGGTTQVFGDTKGGGLFNVLIGTSAGNAMTGQKNIMIGDYTCLRATAINNTVAIGVQSGPLTDYQGDNNFFLGYKAGYNMTGGSRNVHIGQGSGISGTYSDRLFIGNPGEPTNLESTHIITGYFNTGVLRFPKGYANNDSSKFLTTGSDGTLVLSDIKSVIPVPTVNDGKLTLGTSGIATGSGSFTANQATSGSFTVNVPGTNITATLNESKVLNISSSTGTGGSVNLSSLIPTNYVPTARTIIAGDGLSGGGDLSADRTIALGTPGSITAASTNNVTATSHTHELGANSIVTTKIANSAVTFAKLQNIPAQTLMGRYASGAGVVQPVTLGTGLSLNASGVLSATNTSSGTVTSVGASTGGNAINVSGSPVTSSGTLVFGFQGTENQYINGIGNLVTFPTIPSGTVTSVTIGNGLTGASPITSAGTITLGTPGSITLSSNNSVTANSHSHAFSPGGTVNQYVSGAGTLITFPTIPTPTRLRGTETGTYTAGDLSLLGGAGITISQSGADFTIVNTAPHVPYVLPAATTSTLGGIKVGARLSIASGVLSADNMIQGLSLAGQTLSISGGNSVTLPVANNGILTLKATGIATGGTATFSANQASNAAWTVNVPGTNLSADFNTATHVLNISSSTGNGAAPIDLSSLYGGELIRQTASTGYGWRLKDSDDLSTKAQIGQFALDFTYEDNVNDPGTSYGPTGLGSAAFGRWQTVSGTVAFAAGGEHNLSNDYGAAFGLGNNISGRVGFAAGYSNNLTSLTNIALGSENQATGNLAIAIGYLNYARSYGEIAIGLCGTDYTPASTTAFNNNDRLFNIGNGPSYNNKHDAFTILKSGVTIINNLSGTGNRMVIADPSGALSTQAISIDGVTSVTIGNGLSGASPITSTGTITLGTPSAITATSTNSVTATSHTHALANGAVTYAKFQNIPTGTLLGRGATGTGVISAVTLGTGLSLSTAGVLSATNTNSGTVTSVATSIGGNAINVSGSPITSSGTLAFAFQGTAGQYINGSGDLVAFPAIPSPYTLPAASASVLGGIKVGNRLSIASGVLSADNMIQNLSVSGQTLSISGGNSVVLPFGDYALKNGTNATGTWNNASKTVLNTNLGATGAIATTNLVTSTDWYLPVGWSGMLGNNTVGLPSTVGSYPYFFMLNHRNTNTGWGGLLYDYGIGQGGRVYLGTTPANTSFPQWAQLAQITDIPTNNNQLTNGAGYITSVGTLKQVTDNGNYSDVNVSIGAPMSSYWQGASNGGHRWLQLGEGAGMLTWSPGAYLLFLSNLFYYNNGSGNYKVAVSPTSPPSFCQFTDGGFRLWTHDPAPVGTFLPSDSFTQVFGLYKDQIQFEVLKGVGQRMMVANADGTVVTQSIPVNGVTSVTIGNGLTGTSPITSTGTVTLGTPSAITLSSTNSVTAGSHTHAFTPGGTTAQYIRGNGTLATFPTIPTVGNGILTIQQNGSTVGTFSANQSANTTINLAGGSGTNEIVDNGYSYGKAKDFGLGWDATGGFAANTTVVSDPTYNVTENDYTIYCISQCTVVLPDPREYPNRMLRIVGGLGDNTIVRFNDFLPINYLNGTISQIISTSILIQAIVKGDLAGWYLVGGSL